MEVDSTTEVALENAIGWNIPKIEESNIGTETGMKRYKKKNHLNVTKRCNILAKRFLFGDS